MRVPQSFNVNELSGVMLDLAVNQAEGLEGILMPVRYSSLWDFGGSLAASVDIFAKPHFTADKGYHYTACMWNREGDTGRYPSSGNTPLEAMMRCYVKMKLGDKVILMVDAK